MSEPNKDMLRPISVADSETTTVANVDAKDVDTKDMAASAAPSSLREPSAEPEPERAVPVAATDLPEKTPDEAAVATTSDEDDEANFEYPKAFRLVIVTVALALSVFCMALVSLWSPRPHCIHIRPYTDNPTGQYHSRDRHPPHYRRFQSPQ